MAVLGGTLCEEAGGTGHVGGIGSVAIKPAGVPHADTFGSEGLHTLTLEFDAEAFDREVDLNSATRSYRWVVGGPLFAGLATLADELHLECADSAAAIEAAAIAAIDHLADVPAPRVSTAPRWLSAAEEYVRVNSRRPICVRDLAALVGVHRAHLHRVFRAYHRCTIGAYVRRLRVERAAKALQQSSDSIVKIALDCGFSDQPHMTRLFRKWVGVTPATYRASVRPA